MPEGSMVADQEQFAANPDMHHLIGKSEIFPKDICLYVQKHRGDPAVEVSIQ